MRNEIRLDPQQRQRLAEVLERADDGEYLTLTQQGTNIGVELRGSKFIDGRPGRRHRDFEITSSGTLQEL